MFKKLQDWLFKEDLEELDLEGEDFSYLEEEEEEIVQKPKMVKPPVEEKIEVEEVKVVSKPKINIDIKADDPKKEKGFEKGKREQVKRPPLTRKDDFEIPQVISPFFGVSGEDNKKSETVNTNFNEVTYSSTKKETFNAVISPYYGQKENKGEIYQTKNNNVGQSSRKLSDATIAENSEEYDEDNISLDEIVSSTKQNDDDLIQFSLFGEDKKLQDKEFENEVSDVEENTVSDSNELPF